MNQTDDGHKLFYTRTTRLLHLCEESPGINLYYHRDHKEFIVIKSIKSAAGGMWTHVTSIEDAVKHAPHYFGLLETALKKLKEDAEEFLTNQTKEV